MLKKKKFVSIPDMRQSKTLLTIDERGSKVATISVFDCQWSPVGRLTAIENSVSNYFWCKFVDNIEVFDCHQSGVNSLLRRTFLCGEWTKAHWDKSPLGQKPTGQYPTGQKPTA